MRGKSSLSLIKSDNNNQRIYTAKRGNNLTRFLDTHTKITENTTVLTTLSNFQPFPVKFNDAARVIQVENPY